MKLFFHYCTAGFSNCYLLGIEPGEHLPAEKPQTAPLPPNKDERKEAIIIDPGMMDANLLNMIEKNDYYLRGVLITHDHPHHVRGLRAIQRIYKTEIYAINPLIGEHRTTLVHDGETVKAGPFKIEVFSVPGHSADSAVYRIDRLLFTGDAISAGLIGNTASSYSAATLVSALRRKILSLPGNYTILPGHGPPSSLEAERRFNLDLNSFEQQKKHRPAFRI